MSTAQTQEKDINTAQNTDQDYSNTIFLVDGSGYIFRAYHALPPLTRPDGTPIGAVLGFSNMILKLCNDYNAQAVGVVFDAGRYTFRNELYEDYKANRDEPPEDLIPQFGLVREATAAFGLQGIEMEGFEADDVIATYAAQARAKGQEVVIVSSDKDLMQLVGPGVRMLDPIKNRLIGPDEVMEKFGVAPEKVIEVQALIGDKVDNIPGIPGIGPKTAAELIDTYGDLETLLERAEEIKQPKRRQSLIDHAKAARLSKTLVILKDDITDLPDLGSMTPPDLAHDGLIAFLQENGFKNLLSRLGQNADTGQGEPNQSAQTTRGQPGHYETVSDAAQLQAIMDQAMAKGLLAIDTETTSLTPAAATLVGVSLSVEPGKAFYVPLMHGMLGSDLFKTQESDDISQLSTESCISILKPVLEHRSVVKVAHNMKYDWQILDKHGIHMTPVDDTMLLSYVLDGTQHSNALDELAKLHFDYTMTSFKEVCGSGKSQIGFDEVPIDKATHYAAEDADFCLRLYHLLKPRLAQEKMTSVYEDIERPLIEVIARMEAAGITVDAAVLKAMSGDFAKQLEALEKDIHALAGHGFNIGSPKQLGEVLFDEMGLQGSKKTKSGTWSTAVDVLEKLAVEGHEIVEKVLTWRQLSKLKSTYTDALPGEINVETGRVHTSFAMAAVNTGRLSSSDPNLQNIPIRTEEGRKIRTAFVAKEGHLLLSADYSQVELRLVAAMGDVKALKRAFQEGLDIHAHTASEVFGVPMEEMTPEIRRRAKAINFGIIYGISGWGLAKQLQCEPAEANEYIKSYLQRLPELQAYMDAKKAEAKKHGYVRTLYGRKCYIAGIRDNNANRRHFAERQAINAPLQGTAADIMKMAMVKLPHVLEDEKLDATMLLQVHDEVIFEVPKAQVDAVKKVVCETMEGIADIGVPLVAEANAAKNWAEAH